MRTVIAIQARISSRRFPGKVLAKLNGSPIIEHVIANCKRTNFPVFVLTSNDSSDDELASYLHAKHIDTFRGDLTNVLDRFYAFASKHNFDYVIRISADSPLIHPDVIKLIFLQACQDPTISLTTNVHPRTFPRGQSVEVLPYKTLNSLTQFKMRASDHEHVTKYIYENAGEFRILNVLNDENISHVNLCVDTPDDLNKMESFIRANSLSPLSGLPPWKQFSDLITTGSL